MRQKLKILFLALCIVIIILLPQPFPDHLLKADFQIYWSASYLLREGQNFADTESLLAIQQQLSGWDDTENVLVTWNPPWFLVWLIPFTFLKFDKASWIWFLTNLSMIFASTTLLWLSYSHSAQTKRKSSLATLVAMLFTPTMTTLLVGQIATVVLFGLVGFLYFERRNIPFYAGLFLALTSIKPHILYIILPILLLDALINKRWQIIAGFLLPIVAGITVAFILRPSFLSEYLLLMGSGRVLKYTPPTLSSMLSVWLNWPWLKLVAIVILPIYLLAWWFHWRHRKVNWLDLTGITLFVSVITAPYGWSFDAIVLLIPLIQCLVWIVEKQIPSVSAFIIGFGYILANSLILYQRSLGVGEDAYFWFPIFLAGLYTWGRYLRHRWINTQPFIHSAA